MAIAQDKLSTRNLPTYRDASVILINQLKEIFIDAELDLVETAIWVPKLIRRDYQMAVSQIGNGVDDPIRVIPRATRAARAPTWTTVTRRSTF